MSRTRVGTWMLMALSGCEEESVCVEGPEPTCAPAYSPTYAAVYKYHRKDCTVGSGACHDAHAF